MWISLPAHPLTLKMLLLDNFDKNWIMKVKMCSTDVHVNTFLQKTQLFRCSWNTPHVWDTLRIRISNPKCDLTSLEARKCHVRQRKEVARFRYLDAEYEIQHSGFGWDQFWSKGASLYDSNDAMKCIVSGRPSRVRSRSHCTLVARGWDARKITSCLWK